MDEATFSKVSIKTPVRNYDWFPPEDYEPPENLEEHIQELLDKQ